jgi:hypothetical protein
VNFITLTLEETSKGFVEIFLSGMHSATGPGRRSKRTR